MAERQFLHHGVHFGTSLSDVLNLRLMTDVTDSPVISTLHLFITICCKVIVDMSSSMVSYTYTHHASAIGIISLAITREISLYLVFTVKQTTLI